MSAKCVKIDDLWNADAYWQSGKSPWTIFAFPVSLADSHGLPRDDEALRYLSELAGLGVSVGIWAHPDIADTIYFACPHEERESVDSAIKQLEQLGRFPPEFDERHCALLFGDP